VLGISDDPHLAGWYHERIEKHVNDFAEELNKEEGLSVTVVLNDGTRIAASWFGYHNPEYDCC